MNDNGGGTRSYPSWNEILRNRAKQRAEWLARLSKGRRGLRRHR